MSAGTLAYLYENPQLVSDYLERNPEHYDEVERYFAYRKANAKSEEQISKYEKAEYNFAVTVKPLEEQLDLENNPDFLRDLAMVESLARTMDDTEDMNRYTKKCSIKIAESLLLHHSQFNKEVNTLLPKINDGTQRLFNFDKYQNLKSEWQKVESDHIPSYKALEWFFINNKVDLSKLKKIKNKYDNLNKNATAINLPYETHRNNRTTGQKNNFLAAEDGKSSKTLRNATIKDFTTILWVEKKNSAHVKELLNAFAQMYIRNKLLCLYDIEKD